MSPLAESVTVEQLEARPYEVLAELRSHEPVAWIPALNGWLVTRRDLCIEAMRDADAFTVDDERFSTAAVLGPSMLSLDGKEHERHRSPFAPSFRPGVVRKDFDDFLTTEARRLVAQFAADEQVELRSQLAGPLAVNTITRFLGLRNVTSAEVLDWYASIANAILDVTLGNDIADKDHNAIRELHARVAATVDAHDDSSVLHEIIAQGVLAHDEVATEAAVIMFGAIETSEGMTANALWHLLTHPDALAEVRADRTLISAAIEESLRLEPAAAVIDRYATRDVDLGGTVIPAGDLVTISLLGSNRDPAVFDRPDEFRLHRENSRQHVTFVQGPHGCLGLHLARMETAAALNAMLDTFTHFALDESTSSEPHGLIFRKPHAVTATWSP